MKHDMKWPSCADVLLLYSVHVCCIRRTQLPISVHCQAWSYFTLF